MRSYILLLSAVSNCLVQSRWMRWTDSGEARSHIARPTQASDIDESSGWTPKPTRAPGSRIESEAVLELLKRASSISSFSSSANTWENKQSCGWYAGTSSSALTCESGFTCATNTDNVVGCTSTTFAQFYTECLNYDAVAKGACESVGAATGCCETSTEGACGTYLWSGSPTRSMYRCFATPTVILMNDEPQFVIDAHTRTTSSSSSVTTTSNDTSVVTTSSTATSTETPAAGDGGSGTPVGAIVGGVVGGLAFLTLVALTTYCVMRSKQKNTLKMNLNRNKTTNNYKTPDNHPDTDDNHTDASDRNANNSNAAPVRTRSTKPRDNVRTDSFNAHRNGGIQGQNLETPQSMVQIDGKYANPAVAAPIPPSSTCASNTTRGSSKYDNPLQSQSYYDPTRPEESQSYCEPTRPEATSQQRQPQRSPSRQPNSVQPGEDARRHSESYYEPTRQEQQPWRSSSRQPNATQFEENPHRARRASKRQAASGGNDNMYADI